MSNIDDKYASLPDAASILGDPAGLEGAALDGGQYRHYRYGSIYSSPSAGTHEVHGAIHAKWASLGWERGVLGYPTTDETGTPDGFGRFNHFEHGSIYWTPSTGAHEVHGPIHDLWSQNAWETGSGYPVTDVETLADFGMTEVSWFTGRIIANPQISPGEPFMVDPGAGALLVVAPNEDFVAAASAFMSHKRRTGMPAFLHVLTPEESDPTGDAPYRLKGRIAEAASWLGVRWVLLLGDASLVPTRHRYTGQIPAGHLATAWYTPTDFYYADLYAAGILVAVPVGSTPTWIAPDSWDANGDSRFDEHHWNDDTNSQNPDNVQAIPTVAIGRVPAHTADEAAAYLAKVVAYESHQQSGTTAVSILTDHRYYSENGNAYLAGTFMDRAGLAHDRVVSVGLDWPAGERTPEVLEPRERWAIRTAAAASRTLVYIGHGGPSAWAVGSDTFGTFDDGNVRTFANDSNYPIVMAAGCATSPIMNGAPEAGRYRGIDGNAHDYTMSGSTVVDSAVSPPAAPVAAPVEAVLPSPLDFSDSTCPGFASGWLLNPAGGGIAYFGETAVAPDIPGVELLGRVLGHMHSGAILGNAWMAGQAEYRSTFLTSEDRISAPRVYLTYMHLFGDPSLRLW